MEDLLQRTSALFDEGKYPMKLDLLIYRPTLAGPEHKWVRFWYQRKWVCPKGGWASRSTCVELPLGLTGALFFASKIAEMKAVSSIIFRTHFVADVGPLFEVLSSVPCPHLRGLEIRCYEPQTTIYDTDQNLALFPSLLTFLERVPEIYRLKVFDGSLGPASKLREEDCIRLLEVLQQRGDFKTFVYPSFCDESYFCFFPLTDRNRHNHLQKAVTLLDLLLRLEDIPRPVFFQSQRKWARAVQRYENQ